MKKWACLGLFYFYRTVIKRNSVTLFYLMLFKPYKDFTLFIILMANEL